MSDFLELKSRIAILDQNDKIVGFIDNELPNALPFWDDELHEYLEGTSNTFTFKTDARHDDSLNLLEGYKIAFKTSFRDYYLNIVKVIRDEETVEIEAWSTNLELLNEKQEAFDCPEGWTFKQYLDKFDPEHTVTLGVNEVSSKQIKNKWDGSSTTLSRLYSLANVFGAEIEFVPELNEDYSIKRIVMNVYREHSDNDQGIGKRNSLNLVYGKDIEGVKKTSDITDLYTCIRPKGGTPEGSDTPVRLSGYSVDHVKDEDGKILYFLEGDIIRAPQARDRFPSYASASNDRYILLDWDCDVTDQATLYGRALAELKKNCQPQVTYEIDGFADTGIGDTVRITDFEYNPILYLEARVTEQVRSFTDPSRNKTTYSNINVLQSQIDSSLLARVEALIQANKVYIGEIITDNGIQFVNGAGHTTLTARVLDGVVNIVQRFSIKWFKDGTQISTDQSILVDAGDFGAKAVYRFEAYQGTRMVAQSEATLTNVADGQDGQNGLPSYLHVRYSNDGGLTFTGNNGKTGGDWMGTYTDHLETDSELVSDYTWVRIKGTDGQSLTDMRRQFYLSTSDTEQVGGAWLNTYPTTFDGSKYLWMRWRATYENPDSVVFSTPELDLTWTQVQAGLDKAQQAIDTAQQAKDDAKDALDTANGVKTEADQIKADLEPIKQGVDDAKKLAQEAKDDVATETQKVLTQIEGSYATKSEVTELEGELKAQIIADATQIATNVSETVAQNNKSKIDSLLLGFNEELSSKMATLDELTSSNSEANKTLLDAKNTLADLEKDLEELKKSPDATQDQIDTLQNAVDSARDAVSDAQSVVDDNIEQIKTIRQEIETLAKDSVQKLTSRVTTNETKIEQNATAISLKANTSDVNTSISGLRTDLEGKISVESGKIESAVSKVNTLSQKVDGLKVGATNLALKSDEEKNNNGYKIGMWWISPTEGTVMSNGYGHLVKGETYCMTICVTPATNVTHFTALASDGYFGLCAFYVEGAKKQVVSKTFVANYAADRTPTDKPDYARIDLYRYPNDGTVTENSIIHWIKIEKGTVPTDWSPAPEDIDEDIDTTKTNLEGLISSTEERVSSFVTQTATGIEQEVTQRVTEIQGDIQTISEATSILSQRYNGFEMSFNEFREIVNNDNQLTGEQLSTIQKFIRFIEGNIILGEEGNAQMLKIAKDRISFLQGDNEVAYISNNTLYIYDGVFLNSLRIQNYVWIPRANGHLSLKKVR